MKLKYKLIFKKNWSLLFLIIVFIFLSGLSSEVQGHSNLTIYKNFINDSYTIQSPFLKENRNILYVGGSGGNNYTYIQDAINASNNGDTIVVYSGTYYENQIIINKALTVQGSGWTTTIIDGSFATLTSTGLIRITTNGNVIFQGFSVKNAGGPPNGGDYNDNLTNVGIYVQSASSSATYYISENKILGTNEPDDWEDYGFYTNSGQEHLIFTNNIVTQTAANSILIEKHIGSTEINYNTLDAGCWGIDPIYFMTYSGVNIISAQKICNNIIDVGTGINPHGPSDNKITAIGFSSAYLGCTGTTDSGKYTNIEISNNIINNVQAYERGIALDNFAWGDGSEGEISNAVIKGNTINSISTTQPSFGIRLSGLISDTIIQDNKITNGDMSFWGRTGYYGSSTGYPTGTMINYNNFENNNQGLVWENSNILNAENNWWGDATGPQHPGNPSGIGDPVNGNVDYFPWLIHPFGPPFAEFDYTVTGKTVTFDASESGDYDGAITSYDWNFGDGTFGTGKITSHTYILDITYNVTLKVTDDDGKNDTISKNIIIINHAPNKPEIPSGDTSGKVGIQYVYTTKTTDIDGDQELWYWFNWGDDTNSGWIGPFAPNENAVATHTWTKQGKYDITVKAKDFSGAESIWSDPLRISMPRNKIISHQIFIRFLQILQQLLNL